MAKGPPKQFTTIVRAPVTPEMKAALEREAVRRGCSIAQLIRNLAQQIRIMEGKQHAA